MRPTLGLDPATAAATSCLPLVTRPRCPAGKTAISLSSRRGAGTSMGPWRGAAGHRLIRVG
jgi:hypothetical protein